MSPTFIPLSWISLCPERVFQAFTFVKRVRVVLASASRLPGVRQLPDGQEGHAGRSEGPAGRPGGNPQAAAGGAQEHLHQRGGEAAADARTLSQLHTHRPPIHVPGPDVAGLTRYSGMSGHRKVAGFELRLLLAKWLKGATSTLS